MQEEASSIIIKVFLYFDQVCIKITTLRIKRKKQPVRVGLGTPSEVQRHSLSDKYEHDGIFSEDEQSEKNSAKGSSTSKQSAGRGRSSRGRGGIDDDQRSEASSSSSSCSSSRPASPSDSSASESESDQELAPHGSFNKSQYFFGKTKFSGSKTISSSFGRSKSFVLSKKY